MKRYERKKNKKFVSFYLIYKNVMVDAKYDMIIPDAANVPPINVTVRYEYFTDNMLDNGPIIRCQKERINKHLLQLP